MKKILLIAASLLMIFIANAQKVYEVTANRLNVRNVPNNKAVVIGTISRGEKVKVIEELSSGWSKIDYFNRYGFVSSNYLHLAETLNANTEDVANINEQIKDDQAEEPVQPILEKQEQSNNLDDEDILNPTFAVVQYQMGSFKQSKESGCYGIGVMYTSIKHWGNFHIGADFSFSINAGFVKSWGCIIDFGPSVRADISKRFFINMPINAVCNVIFPEGITRTKSIWGVRLVPSIHTFLTDKIGIFIGPQLNFGFSKGSKATIGMQAGLSYAF